MDDRTHHSLALSRRDFLRAAGLAAAGLVAAGCQKGEPSAQGQAPPTVAIATAQDYDRDQIYAHVRDLLDTCSTPSAA
jgi:hypothetical protein